MSRNCKTPLIDFPPQDKHARRLELLTQAADLLVQALKVDGHDSFFDQERVLAADLIVVGRLATQHTLATHIDPQPQRVLIDSVPYTKAVLGSGAQAGAFGGSLPGRSAGVLAAAL